FGLGGLAIGEPAPALADALRAGDRPAVARARARRLAPQPAARACAARAGRGDLDSPPPDIRAGAAHVADPPGRHAIDSRGGPPPREEYEIHNMRGPAAP